MLGQPVPYAGMVKALPVGAAPRSVCCAILTAPWIGWWAVLASGDVLEAEEIVRC